MTPSWPTPRRGPAPGRDRRARWFDRRSRPRPAERPLQAGRLGRFALPLALVLVAGCDDGGPTPSPTPNPVQQVELAAPRTAIHVGETMQLTAVARNAQGVPVPGPGFQWASSDTLVARVSNAGLVTAVAPGSAAIRATTAGRFGQVEVGVTAPPAPPPPVPVLASLSPVQVLERSGELDLVVQGTDFQPESRVLWNGVPVPTTFVTGTRLVARVPAAYTGQPLEAGISVETISGNGPGAFPRSEPVTFRVLPRPLASVRLDVAGNHLFFGQLLDHDIVMRNDLGEAVIRPGLVLFSGDESVVGFDWMGHLRGRSAGSTSLRATVGELSAEVNLTVGPPPARFLAVEAWPDGVPELFVLEFDPVGSQLTRFERILPRGTRAAEPSVSSDGSRIAFAGTAEDGSVNVWTVRRDGTDLRRLTNDAFRADQPAWSPDGSRLAFRTFRRGLPEIWVMNADGTHSRPLLGGPTMIPEEENHFPAWLPDGRRIVFSRGFGAERTLHVARVDQGVPAAHLTELVRIPGYHAERPSPAPEGGYLVFEARDRDTGEVRILMTSTVNGAMLFPLNPPSAGIRRPALLGGDWVAAIGPNGMESPFGPTLRIQELNGPRVSIPVPSWAGRIESVALGGR